MRLLDRQIKAVPGADHHDVPFSPKMHSSLLVIVNQEGQNHQLLFFIRVTDCIEVNLPTNARAEF